MIAEMENKLHWSQSIALMRHNLHAASRSGDFGFFKTLQAQGFMEGTNQVAALIGVLEDDADSVLAAMDNLHAALAYAHQDAFKNVYDSAKAALSSESEDKKVEARCKLFVDASMQRSLADQAIDKITSSAINLINLQPVEAQDTAAKVWITGTTIIADAMDVALKQLDSLESRLDDFIRMEDSWNTVRLSVICSITGMKGVFELMDPNGGGATRSSPRNSSIASAGVSVLRRLSNAFAPAAGTSRNASIVSLGPGPPLSAHFPPHHNAPVFGAPVYRTPNFRSGGAKGGAAHSFGSSWATHKFSGGAPEDNADPLDTTVSPKVHALPVIPCSPTTEIPPEAGNKPFDGELRSETAVM